MTVKRKASKTAAKNKTGLKAKSRKPSKDLSQLEAVAQIGALASSTLDISEVLNHILMGTLKAVDASVGMIFLRDQETGCLQWGVSYGLSEAFVEAFRNQVIKPGEGLSGRIAQTGETIYIAKDSSHDPRIARPVIRAEGLNTFIGVPVYAEDKIVAVMNILTRLPDVLPEEKIPLIKAVGTQVGLAIRNAQLFKERMKTEEELLRSEEKYREVVEGTADLITRVNERGEFTYVNRVGEKILGLAPGQLIGLSAFDFIHPDDRNATVSWFDDVTSRRLDHATIENRQVNRSTGEVYTMIWTCKFYYGPNGTVTGINGIARDITDRKKIEEQMQIREKRLRQAQHLARIGNWIYDIQNGNLWWSEELYHVFSISPEDGMLSLERFLSRVHSEDREALQAQIASGLPYRSDYRIVIPDGQIKHIHEEVEIFRDQNGKDLRYEGIAQDITERKQAEEIISASLKEKEVLLREIHHRVKNNMTIVSSLLEMQTSFTTDEHDREMLNDAKSRIKAMSLIHEKLYRSRDLARVDFNDYLKDILNSMFASYLKDPGRIVMKLDVRDVTLAIDDAIPCGLIINELVSNSLKHAFPEGTKGEISLTMLSDEKGGVELTVADDGIGLPEDVDSRKNTSMGLSLVDALVGQLQGTIEQFGEKGAGFRIIFTRSK